MQIEEAFLQGCFGENRLREDGNEVSDEKGGVIYGLMTADDDLNVQRT